MKNIPTLCFASGRIGHKVDTRKFYTLTLLGSQNQPTASNSLHSQSLQTDKEINSSDFGPRMMVTRRTHRQRPEQRIKPVRTPVLTPQQAAQSIPQTETNIMILPSRPVDSLEDLPHTDLSTQPRTKGLTSDSRHHAISQNRFSQLAYLVDEDFGSAREETTSSTYVTSLASTSDARIDYVDVDEPNCDTIPCKLDIINKPCASVHI